MGISNNVEAQEVSEEPPVITEQQLDELTASNEDIKTEDDTYLQQLEHFLKEPLNLHDADAGVATIKSIKSASDE